MSVTKTTISSNGGFKNILLVRHVAVPNRSLKFLVTKYCLLFHLQIKWDDMSHHLWKQIRYDLLRIFAVYVKLLYLSSEWIVVMWIFTKSSRGTLSIKVTIGIYVSALCTFYIQSLGLIPLKGVATIYWWNWCQLVCQTYSFDHLSSCTWYIGWKADACSGLYLRLET